MCVYDIIVFQHFFPAHATFMKFNFNYRITGRGNTALRFVIFMMVLSCSIKAVENLVTVLALELAFICNQLGVPALPLFLFLTFVVFMSHVVVYYPVIFQEFLSTQEAGMKLTFNDHIIG